MENGSAGHFGTCCRCSFYKQRHSTTCCIKLSLTWRASESERQRKRLGSCANTINELKVPEENKHNTPLCVVCCCPRDVAATGRDQTTRAVQQQPSRGRVYRRVVVEHRKCLRLSPKRERIYLRSGVRKLWLLAFFLSTTIVLSVHRWRVC